MGKLIQLPLTLNPVQVVSLTERHRKQWDEQDRKLEELLNSDLSDDEVIKRVQELFKK
jgi:predicted KAP-like P-loop ATPase